MEPTLLQIVALIVGPGGAVYVGSKMAFNGIYKRLDRTESKIDVIDGKVSRNGERIAKLEGRP